MNANSSLAVRVCRVLQGMTLLEEPSLINQERLKRFWDQVYMFTHLVLADGAEQHKDWLILFEEIEKGIELAVYTPR